MFGELEYVFFILFYDTFSGSSIFPSVVSYVGVIGRDYFE